MDTQLQYVDQMLQRLVDGLTERGLLDCVNLIVLADHGMASSVGIPDHVIKLEDYIPDISDLANTVFTGAVPRIDPKNESEGECRVKMRVKFKSGTEMKGEEEYNMDCKLRNKGDLHSSIRRYINLNRTRLKLVRVKCIFGPCAMF